MQHQLDLFDIKFDRETGIELVALHWNCEEDQMILHLLQYAIVQSIAHHV